MNSHSAFSLLFSLTLIISCSSPSIKLSQDFDRGSIGIITEEEPGLFKGNTKHWLKRDSIGDQYYWFYFKAVHVKDKMVSFELTDLIGNYRKKTISSIQNIHSQSIVMISKTGKGLRM